jgi:hypothetical protein
MPLRVGAIYLLIIAAIAALVPVWAKFAQAATEFRPPGKIAFDLQGHRPRLGTGKHAPGLRHRVVGRRDHARA